jgi:hypothetical protein
MNHATPGDKGPVDHNAARGDEKALITGWNQRSIGSWSFAYAK